MRQLCWPARIVPHVLRAGRFRLADIGFAPAYQGAYHALHCHDYDGQMRLAGEMVDIVAGDITLSPANHPTAYDLRAPGFHWCIHFAAGPLPDAASAAPWLHLALHLRSAAAGAVREKMANIHSLWATGSSLGAVAAALALQQLLVWLVSQGRYGGDLPPLVVRALAIIADHFHEPLTMGEIARRTGVSQPHLARCFRAHLGVTVAHRLAERRMDHARFLLESTDLPIWRIAERCGIPDPQHFNKRVHQWWGTSPTGVRSGVPAIRLIDPDR